MMVLRGALILTVAASPASLLAQEAEPVIEPEGGTLVLDIRAAQAEANPDPILAEQCQAQADAARIAGEIVVCRSLAAPTDGAWNQADFERRYAEATQGVKTPGVDGTGVQLPGEGSLISITVTTSFGDPPPPPLIIDVSALPEAPPGSDADRIARGLAVTSSEGP